MSRGGFSGFGPGFSNQDKKKLKQEAKEEIARKYGLNAKSGNGKGKPRNMEELKKQLKGGSDNYKQMLEDRMLQYKLDLIKRASFGANAGRELSESTKAALDMIAEKMAKKEIERRKKKQKAKEELDIKPRNFGIVGRIDSRGFVYNSLGHVVMRVDKKTGLITDNTMFGRRLGKYDPEKPGSINRLYRLLEQRDAAAKQKLEQQNTGWGGAAAGGGGDWFWGGDGGGSDDNGSWFWG